MTRLLVAGSGFTVTWTAVNAGSLNLVDLLLVAALVSVALDRQLVSIPLWVLSPTLGALGVISVDTLLRVSDMTYNPAVFVMKMALATTVPGLIIINLARHVGAPGLHRLLRWIAHGATLNASAAIAVERGWLSLPTAISAQQAEGDRLSGLAFHPNSLAFSLVLALPLYVYLATEAKGWTKLWWLLSLAIAADALILADSRAGYLVGIAGAVLALTVRIAIDRVGRTGRALLLAGAVAVFVGVALPYLATETRFGTSEALQSDLGRAQINAEAWRIFAAEPFLGAGYSSQTGVAVPLQVVTAGGLMFAVFYYAYFVGLAKSAFAGGGRVPKYFTAVLLIALLGYGTLSPGITERASFWIPLCFMALARVEGHSSAGALPDSARRRRHTGARPSSLR